MRAVWPGLRERHGKLHRVPFGKELSRFICLNSQIMRRDPGLAPQLLELSSRRLQPLLALFLIFGCLQLGKTHNSSDWHPLYTAALGHYH